MASLGGFLAVSYLSEKVFTDALDAIWRTNWEDAGGAAQWSRDTPFGILEPPPDVPPPGEAAMPQAGPGDASARLIVDAANLILYLEANARLAIQTAIATRPNIHPNVDALRVSLEDDTLVLSTSGAIDAPDPLPGNFPFTANVRIRPFIPRNARTLYASIKPDVQVDTPFFIRVLAAIKDLFGGDTFAQLKRANESAMAILFGVKIETKVPDAFGLYARLEGCQLSIRPDFVGLFGEAAISTTFSESDLDPTPAVFSFVGIRERFLRLKLSSRRLIADPSFRIRYRIMRGSSGAELGSGAIWSGTDEPFSAAIDMWDDANVQETSYAIDLVAERPPGNVVAHKVQQVKVIDPLDRSHPFVRWRKQHYYTPTATGFDSQPLTILSAIHRTGVRERCKFCDLREGRFDTPYVMQPLDQVPAPEEAGFSTRLCKYCFPHQ